MPDKLIDKLIKNRITVLMFLFLGFFFIIMPALVIIHYVFNGEDSEDLQGILMFSIILIYMLFILFWLFYSSYLKNKRKDQYKNKGDETIMQYQKDGMEVLADATLFGFGKKFGYKRFKIIAGGNGIAIGFVIFSTAIVSLIKFELLTLAAKEGLIFPIYIFGYIAALGMGIRIVKKYMKD
jgi:hypothetical protein